jgi:hypothetical protein
VLVVTGETLPPSIQGPPAGAQPRRFRIELSGRVGEVWLAACAPVSLSRSERATVLEVRADQAALRGILNHLWDLNLEVLSVVAAGEPDVGNGERENE